MNLEQPPRVQQTLVSIWALPLLLNWFCLLINKIPMDFSSVAMQCPKFCWRPLKLRNNKMNLWWSVYSQIWSNRLDTCFFLKNMHKLEKKWAEHMFMKTYLINLPRSTFCYIQPGGKFLDDGGSWHASLKICTSGI